MWLAKFGAMITYKMRRNYRSLVLEVTLANTLPSKTSTKLVHCIYEVHKGAPGIGAAPLIQIMLVAGDL